MNRLLPHQAATCPLASRKPHLGCGNLNCLEFGITHNRLYCDYFNPRAIQTVVVQDQNATREVATPGFLFDTGIELIQPGPSLSTVEQEVPNKRRRHHD